MKKFKDLWGNSLHYLYARQVEFTCLASSRRGRGTFALPTWRPTPSLCAYINLSKLTRFSRTFTCTLHVFSSLIKLSSSKTMLLPKRLQTQFKHVY